MVNVLLNVLGAVLVVGWFAYSLLRLTLPTPAKGPFRRIEREGNGRHRSVPVEPISPAASNVQAASNMQGVSKGTLGDRFKRWRVRPRPPLTGRDWNPRGGFMFLPSLGAVSLIICGTQVLFGPHQTFRLGGLLALLAGLALGALVFSYVLRPPVQQA